MAAGPQKVEHLWILDIQQRAAAYAGEDFPEDSPLDIFQSQVYSFLETHGITPGDKFAIVVLNAIPLDTIHEVFGEGVSGGTMTSTELAVAAQKYQAAIKAPW